MTITTTDVLVVITAITTAINAVMNTYFSNRNKKVTEDARLSTDSKLGEIHGLVNGTLSTTQAVNASLVTQNQNQKEIITRLTPVTPIAINVSPASSLVPESKGEK